MSYHIEYTPDSSGVSVETGSSWTLLLMTLTVFALFLTCVRSFQPDYWTSLLEWILPGDAVVTRTAVNNLLMNLRSGQPISEAAAAFCAEIIHHAGIR